MTEKRWDLREIARSALNEMPVRDRVPFLAEMLCEVAGPAALNLLANARNALSLHMTSLIDEQMGRDDVAVEVQTEPDGPWRPARLIDGRLHWSPGPVGPAEVRYFAAISDACVRANREVPAAIAAALAASSPQSPGQDGPNPPTLDAECEAASETYPPFASTPWEGVNSRERAVAFLEGASGEDIDLMARLLLEGRPIPDAWRPAQAHISAALSSSAGLLRRMTSARAKAMAPLKYQWRPRGCAQGDRS